MEYGSTSTVILMPGLVIVGGRMGDVEVRKRAGWPAQVALRLGFMSVAPPPFSIMFQHPVALSFGLMQAGKPALHAVLPANVAGWIIFWNRPGIFLRHEASAAGRCEFNHGAP